MGAKEVVSAVYAAFAQGDIPTVLGLLAPEVEWHEAEGSPYSPGDGGWIGPQAVLTNLFEVMGGDWTEFFVKPTRLLEIGNVVVMEGRYAATHAVTGRRLDSQVCHVWDVEGGKVTKFQQYMDTAQMQDVMGRSS